MDGPNTAKIDFGNGIVMTVENAVPDANGDYSNVYSMRLGIANTAEKMVEYGDDLKGFSSEVEWDATGLTELQALSPVIGTWSATNPPSAKDLLLLYGSGLINATPGQVQMSFYATDPRLNASRLVSTTLMEDIQRVPPEYPDWAPATASPQTQPVPPDLRKFNGIFARPDGTYFYGNWSFDENSSLPLNERKMTYQEWDIDWTKTSYHPSALTEGIPKWIHALTTRKDDLTNASQTRMAYLQDQTEKYDRMVSILSALITALNKLLEGLTKFS